MVAFDEEGKVSPAFLDDGMGGAHLGVQGVHQGDGPVQFQPAQQGLGGGNLVTLVAHRFHAQGASALRVDGSDQLRALAAAQRFAIQHHHAAILRPVAGVLPEPEGLLKLQHRHGLHARLQSSAEWGLCDVGRASKVSEIGG